MLEKRLLQRRIPSRREKKSLLFMGRDHRELLGKGSSTLPWEERGLVLSIPGKKKKKRPRPREKGGENEIDSRGESFIHGKKEKVIYRLA